MKRRYKRAAIGYTVATIVWVIVFAMDFFTSRDVALWEYLLHGACVAFFAVDAILMFKKANEPDI